jgi:purine-binding chemotaxis protein CheW
MSDLETVSDGQQLLTFMLANQLFGVPVLQVNDVLGIQKLTNTPLAPPAVAGLMNLRGRIVTTIDVRKCLGQPARENRSDSMSVVVDQDGELFSLMIDSVGDVLTLNGETFEKVPPTLDPAWRGVSSGIHKLEDKIMVVLDVRNLLRLASGKSGEK